MSEDVLERNLRLLLRRSYVPALPAPHYRDRLAALFLAEVERRARRDARDGARAPRGLRLALGVGALAAAVVALLLGWRVLRTDAPATREGLLARGAVALAVPGGPWRAADAEERAHGVQVAPPALVAATPADVELDLLVAAGRVHLAERSEVLVELGAEGATATLRAGAAEFHAGDARVALAQGPAWPLRAPGPPDDGADDAAGGREPVAAAPVTAAPEEGALASSTAAATGRVLAGRVLSAATGEPLSEFTVALLAERVGNETPPPVRRTFAAADGRFEWPEPPGGKQRVFVHAPGFALLAAGERDLGAAVTDVELALEPGASLRGSVLDADGNPVAGALVLSEHDTPSDGLFLHGAEHAFWLPIQARSGADGRFELAHLVPGVHTIRASAPGHAPAWAEGVRVPQAPGDELVIELPVGGTVEGTVTRADGGPWADAQLVVLAMDQAQRPRTNFALARTGADGRYRLEHMPPTTMIVVLLRADDRPDVRPLLVIDGTTVTADFGPPRGGTRVAGRLLDRDGLPIANQNLGLFERDGARWDEDWVASTTSTDGSFEFEGVEPGLHLVYLIDTMGRGLRCVGEVRVAPGVPEVVQDVRLAAGELEISVVTAERGEPVPEAAVMLARVEPGGGRTFAGFGATDATGLFAFRELGPGAYVVWAYPSQPGLGHAPGSPVELEAGGTARTRIELGPGGVVDVVVRDPDGRPLEGAVVVFRDEAGEDHTFSRLPYTDARGRLQAVGVAPGRYTVIAQLAGHAGVPVPFRLDPDAEPEVPVVLSPVPTEER